MTAELTEIIFLLDRSGSMSGLEKDTIGGFNSFISKQSKLEGKTKITTILFDHAYEVLWNGVDASQVELTQEHYYVRGTTALLDAIGKTILDVGYRISNTKKEEKPSNIIFVITTDGLENASVEFSYKKIKELIQHQQEKYSWEFIFMGANIDVAAEAKHMGISRKNAYSYQATEEGMVHMYSCANAAVSNKRREKKEDC